MNRYDEAKNEHYNMYMKQAKSIDSWKFSFMLSMIITIISLSITGYLTTRSTLIPYVIEVDVTGNAKNINPATQKKYNPKEQEKEYFLKEFIKKARVISSDLSVVNLYFSTNKFYLTTASFNKYRKIIEAEGTKKLVNDEYTRNIEIKSLTKMSGTENSYQSRWNENLFNNLGELVQEKSYTGIFTIKVETPTTLEELEYNPLGLKITDFSLSKDNN